MSRLNVTLLALLALLLSLVVVNDSWGVTNRDIYNWFRQDPNRRVYTPPVNDSDFEGEIVFPPPNQWAGAPDFWDDLDAGTYTLELPAGRQFTFTNQLIIQETEYNGGLDVGIGRIQALGQPGNVVTMTGEDWGGIVIQTDPRDVLFGDWDEVMRSGNLVENCVFRNVAAAGTVVAIQEAQAFITGCLFENDTHPIGITANGGLYWIASNYFNQPNAAIQCENPLDDEVEEDIFFLRRVISNNHITGHFETAILVTINWNGWISNNLIEFADNIEAVDGIACVNSAEACIVNNVVVACRWGIHADVAWPTVVNNVLIDCNVGIDGTVFDEVNHCLFINNINAVTDAWFNPLTCIVDPLDQQFANLTVLPYDYHLIWASEAINAGDPDPLFNDPDGSQNDMGLFGGPLANQFAIPEGNYDDYCLIEDDEWEDFVELIRDTYRVTNRIDVEEISIEAGTRLQFAQGVCFAMRSGAQAIIGDLDGDPVYFEPIPNTDPITTWSGIWSENQGDGLEMYNCDITGVAVEDTAALTIWGGSDVILQRLNVHDNSADGGIWLWGGNVMLGGDPLDIDEWEGEGNLVENNTGYGVCLQQYTLGNAYIYGNVIRGNGSIDDDETHCGLQLISSKPIFSTTAGAGGLNYITENLVTGIYWVDSYPVWGAVHAAADVIAGNGRDLLLQAGGLGAEIYVDGAAATMNIKACDIYDEQGDPAVRDGILVFNFSASPFNAQGNFWGYAAINPLDPPFVGGVDFTNPLQDPNDEDFYEDIAGIANINVFWAALSAFESENWESAIRLCYQFIGEEPNNAYAPQALDIIEACLLHTNGNFSAYREYCLDLASEQSETAAGMAARWMAIECLAANEDIQGAMSEYQEIAANAQNANE